jgi:hypothetical protein
MTRRPGHALLSVLLALLILGALGASLAARARTHAESARALAGGDVARDAADRALAEAWQQWDGAARAADAVGALRRRTVLADTTLVEVTTWHPAPRLWWISAVALAPGGRLRVASRASGLGAWLVVGAALPTVAVTAAGDVRLSAGAALVPDAGACPQPVAAGLSLGAGAAWQAPPGAVPAGATGGADVVLAAWAAEVPAIAQRATVALPADTALAPLPLADSTGCLGGWGEPRGGSPCAAHWPVVHARGRLTLTGGRAQGVVLADGPLVLDGNTEFAGIVLARGGVTLRGASRLRGLVIALGSLPVTLTDQARVEASGCAAWAALAGGTLLTELPGQGWYQLW